TRRGTSSSLYETTLDGFVEAMISPSGWGRTLRRLRHEANQVLNEPASGCVAMIFHLVIMLLIFASVAVMMMQSVESLESLLPWGMINKVTYIIFTLEYVLRLLLHEGSRSKFVVDPMNLIDLIAIAPFLVEQILYFQLAAADSQQMSSSSLRLLRVARLLRFVRLLRLAKYNSDLKVVGACLYRSRAALYTLCFMLAMSIVIFSSLM
ncbi:MAG: hypothetical protein SGPRY_001346, partial [Prymnesium sp.]